MLLVFGKKDLVNYKNILLLYPFLYLTMNLRALLLIFLWGSCLLSYAQERDTLIFNLIRKKYSLEHIHLPKCSYLHKEKRLIRLTTHLV